MKSLRFCAVGAGAAVFALVGGPRTAKAAGFATQQFGGEQGSVVATNPTAVYFNPGALGFSEGTELGMYGQLAIRHASWTHQLSPNDYDPKMPGVPSGVDIGTANLLNVFGGAAVGGSTHIGNLVLGVGFFAPFFGISHWGKNDAFKDSPMFSGAYDGVQRWFAIDGKIEVLYFSAAAAYKLGPLSIGAAGNFISSTVSSLQAKTRGGNGLPNSLAEGRAFLDVHGFDASVGAGAMVEVVPRQFFIGASYQSQPGLGEQTLKGDLDLTGPGGAVHYDAYLNQALPDVYRVGLKFRPKAIPWEFRLFGDMTRWSVMKTQCVAPQGQPCQVTEAGGQTTVNGEVQANFRRFWKDTYGIRAGASYWLNPSVELFIGGGYETAAVPDETMAPDLFDMNNIQAAVGGRFALTKTLFFTASYTNIQFLNRDTTGKSTLTVQPNGNLYQPPTVEADGGGQYTQWVGVFSGNLEAVF